MTLMLNDLLKRTPLLALIPFVIWALGMTVYTVQWKTQIDYQIERMVVASESMQKQSERIIRLEQNVDYMREDVLALRAVLFNKEKLK
jgi:hypothetical protein